MPGVCGVHAMSRVHRGEVNPDVFGNGIDVV